MSSESGPRAIVGVGASAGGLEAFTQLLSILPVDTGLTLVLVQHLDPRHDSILPELLSSLCMANCQIGLSAAVCEMLIPLPGCATSLSYSFI